MQIFREKLNETSKNMNGKKVSKNKPFGGTKYKLIFTTMIALGCKKIIAQKIKDKNLN